jgi:cobalt-zinc-cadmium efflux system outer membrane protein
MRIQWQTLLAILLVSAIATPVLAQTALTWQQVKDRFEAANPSLRAGQLGIQESKAQEITANLRPNPDVSLLTDQLDPFTGGPYRPLTYALPFVSFSYLHEREHKRELRLDSARQGTGIAESQQMDLERNLLFSLRTAFVATLQAKALLAMAKDNLDYFDKELAINRERFRAGDIARVDLNRLLLQRVQYESDYETAQVGLRTAKITLLMLLNERTAVDRFDVTGPFDFSDRLQPLDDIHTAALEARPDLRAARQAILKARTDHKLAVANGSTDPTFGIDFGRNPPIPVYFGVSVDIPLRLFDRNQGEKERTQIDIQRAERQRDVAEAQVFNDVDAAYFTVRGAVSLLQPYKDTYLKTATDVRDAMAYAYQHGQAALVDYLDAQRDYRMTQVAYINLVGSYLTAAGQLNLAAGREVIP